MLERNEKVYKKFKGKRKSAFTLAEILITLGIIGIVAAMTIPNLIQNNYEKKVVAQLRETQSILSQAVRMAEEEHGDASGWGLSGAVTSGDATTIAEKIKPHLKLAADCGLVDRDAICTPNTSYKALNGQITTTNYGQNSAYYKVKLMNGTSIWWRGANTIEIAGNEYILFWIDVNNSALPNTIGKDLFLFIYENYSVKPEGARQVQNDNNTCSLNSTGWGCAYYVLQNQNMNYLHKNTKG